MVIGEELLGQLAHMLVESGREEKELMVAVVIHICDNEHSS